MDSLLTVYHHFHSSISPNYIIWFVVKIGTNLSWSSHFQARYMSIIIGVSVPLNASANWTGPKSSHLAELFFIARFRTMLLSRYSSWFWARACQGRRSFPRSNYVITESKTHPVRGRKRHGRSVMPMIVEHICEFKHYLLRCSCTPLLCSSSDLFWKENTYFDDWYSDRQCLRPIPMIIHVEIQTRPHARIVCAFIGKLEHDSILIHTRL